MKNNPKAKKLTRRQAHTDEKARLVVREYNQFKRMEIFTATRNAISNRVIPTIETKRQHPTTFRDAVTTYL